MNLDFDSLSPDTARRIDEICDEFESQVRAGRSPLIESLLERVEPSDRAALFAGLLQVALELSVAGASGRESYIQRFPEFREIVEAAFARAGKDATLTCEPDRLTVRCPHCRARNEVPRELELACVVCESCGSRFGLVDDTVPRRQPGGGALGRFRLLRRLGSGAFGSVWQAHDSELERTVAIKIPHPRQTDKEDAERLFREARAAARLRHPNIVSLHEIGREEDQVYLVSDFIPGVTMADWLEAGRPTAREAAEICRKLARALHHAHENGIVHRDVKPSNILIDSDSEPHVMDFGLAKRDAPELTVTVEGQLLGTPAYMSPEQARGTAHDAGPPSDIYSLGVVLFELLTGERPFRGNSRMVIHQVLHDEPVSPRKLNPTIHPDLDTICLKCLRKKEKDRYDSAEEMARDLDRYLRGEPIRARPVSSWAKAHYWIRRHPWVTAGAAMLLAVLILAYSIQLRYYLKSADQRLYYLNITAAHGAWQDDNTVEEVRAKLDDCSAHLRDWEWHYLRRLPESRYRIFGSTEGWVWSLARAHNGRLIATGGGKENQFGELLLWDPEGGPPRELRGHTNLVTAVAFTADGERLASSSWDRTVMVWNPSTGETVKELPLDSLVSSVAFSPDGRWLAAGTSDTRDGANTLLRVWDSGDWSCIFQRVRAVREEHVDCLAFSPDGRWLALAVSGTLPGENGNVCVLSTMDWSERKVLRGHRRFIRTLAFNPSGDLLASGGIEGKVLLWDVLVGKQIRQIPAHDTEVWGVAFSKDGRMLASASWDSTAKVWDVATGQMLRRFKGHKDWVRDVVFSDEERRLLSASDDGTIKSWDLEHAQEVRTLYGGNVVDKVMLSPDWKYVSIREQDGQLKVLRFENHRVAEIIKPCEGAVSDVAFHPNGKFLAICDDTSLILWNLESGSRLHDFPTVFSRMKIRFSPRGELLAGYCPDGKDGSKGYVVLWNASTGVREQEIRTPAASAIGTVQFSPNGELLGVGTASGKVLVYRVGFGGGPIVIPGHKQIVNQLLFSQDNRRILSVSSDRRVSMWDARTGVPVRSAEGNPIQFIGHTREVLDAALNPEETRLATAGFDGTVRIWDTETGQPLLILRGHTDYVYGVFFSRDGHRIASASGDGTIKTWDGTPLPGN